MPKYRVKLSQCPNCGTSLLQAENFCPNCGQENHEIIRPASHLWKELLENIVNIDSRFLHTVRTLFSKPGKLTMEYNAGKRMRYLSPVKIYLFASVLFFILQSVAFKLNNDPNDLLKENLQKDSEEVITINLGTGSVNMSYEEAQKLADLKEENLDSFLVQNDLPPNFFYRKLLRQSGRILNGEINSFGNFFNQAISYGMFLLMPLFGFLLLLFYRRQQKFYVEHLIFSIHLHSIAFIFMFFSTLVDILMGFKALGLIFNLIFMIYGLIALRNVYQESWIKTTAKFLGLLIVYGIFLATTLSVIALIAILIF